MTPIMLELLIRSLWETILMTLASGLISLVAGLPLGLALVATARGGIAENPWINRVLGAVINGFRSVPFIILLVALIPLTRLIVGTALGTWAAIVPLAIAATPYYARIAEVSLREVDRGLIDAVRAMGGNRWTIIREVLVPEALPGIVAGFTVTLVGHGGRNRRRRPRRSGHPLWLSTFRNQCDDRGGGRPHRARLRHPVAWRPAGCQAGPPISQRRNWAAG